MNDILQCSAGQVRMCDLPKVIRETSCAMPLMSGSQNEVDQYCLRHAVPFPQAVACRLGNKGQGLYIVPEPTVLDVKCPDRTLNSWKTLGGQQVVQIPDSCTDYADSFKMPSHFQGESSLELKFVAPLSYLY